MTYITSIMPTFHNLPRYGASLAENLIALLAAGHQRIRAKPRFASIYRGTRFPIVGGARDRSTSTKLDSKTRPSALEGLIFILETPVTIAEVLDPLSKGHEIKIIFYFNKESNCSGNASFRIYGINYGEKTLMLWIVIIEIFFFFLIRNEVTRTRFSWD